MGINRNQCSSPSLSKLCRHSLRVRPDSFPVDDFYREWWTIDSAGTVKSRRMLPTDFSQTDAPDRLVTHPTSAPALKTFSSSTETSHEQFCLSGGGNVKYRQKPRQQKTKRTQDPLVALPPHKGKHKDDARYFTRSVPIHSAGRKTNEVRGSNSAPMPSNHHRTNHDRKPTSHMPRLPKINKLLKEPLQQQVHGTSTATEAGRKENSGKRWASSWAGARATNPSMREEPRVAVSDNSNQLASNSNSPNKMSSVRQSSHQGWDVNRTSPAKSSIFEPSKESEKKVSGRDGGIQRTESLEPKTKSSLESNSKNSSLKESKFKGDMRTTSLLQIDTKVTKSLPSRSKSSAILTTHPEVTRQTSQSSSSSAQMEVPKIRTKTDSRDSQNTSTTQRSHVQPAKKKRSRKPVIITRKSVIKQKTLQSVYGNKTIKYQRQIRVLKKMEQVQRKEVEEFNMDLKEKQKHKMASVVKQRMALKKVRDRFDEEQVRRFRHQYVSWHSVEGERLNHSSEIYGLPDFIYEDRYEKTLKKIPESQASTSTKTAPKKFHKYATWVRNLKVFENLLNPKVGGNMEEAFQQKGKTIIEGIDTIKLDNSGSARKKKVNVKRLIGSAKKLLTVTDNMDDISEVSPYREDDSSDDDDSPDPSEDEGDS